MTSLSISRRKVRRSFLVGVCSVPELVWPAHTCLMSLTCCFLKAVFSSARQVLAVLSADRLSGLFLSLWYLLLKLLHFWPHNVLFWFCGKCWMAARILVRTRFAAWKTVLNFSFLWQFTPLSWRESLQPLSSYRLSASPLPVVWVQETITAAVKLLVVCDFVVRKVGVLSEIFLAEDWSGILPRSGFCGLPVQRVSTACVRSSPSQYLCPSLFDSSPWCVLLPL